MKINIFKSFRFEIVIYSLQSLLYSLLTEAGIFLFIYGVKTLVENITNNRITENADLRNQVYYGAAVTAKAVNETEHLGVSKGIATLIIVSAIILGIVLFITYFLMLTKRFTNYLDEIAKGITQISAGDFDTRIDIKNEDEFTIIASRINKMADDVKRIMENERKNEFIKNDLITSVAHDLRTPLTSIIGYLDLVSSKKEISQETKKQYLSIAYNKSKRLEKLIEDLFAFTKFSSEEVTMHPFSLDMVKFMEQLGEEFYPSFQEAGLEYEFKTNKSIAIIQADGDLLFRAFANLIGNAVKYGKDGKRIKIELNQTIDQVIITITNFGVLIPEKDLENIFDRLYRVESSRSRDTGGSGLGLAIAKNIIGLHNGAIKARSDFGGTVFEVTLKN